MPKKLTRRKALAGISVGVIAGSAAAGSGERSASAAGAPKGAVAEAYAAFRVVREKPGEPTRPEIRLPDGYRIVSGDQYSVASRAEFYTFVVGRPTEDGIDVTVRWPGTRVSAVIHGDERARLRPDPEDPDAFGFRLPVTAESVGATQGTIQVWSQLDTVAGIAWRIEHNDPARAAGPWSQMDWPAGQVAAVVQYLIAAESILIDSGAAEVAAAKGHFYSLMGFETNNTLHPDNPPHWHLAYYAGGDHSAPACLPHFWFDSEGRNFYNGQDVTGEGRTAYRVGDPAPMYDFAGNLVLTQTVREDGGLDIDPPGGPGYSIVPGRDGAFVEELTVLRDGAGLARIAAIDDVRKGRMRFDVEDLTGRGRPERVEYRYDPLTGVLRSG